MSGTSGDCGSENPLRIIFPISVLADKSAIVCNVFVWKDEHVDVACLVRYVHFVVDEAKIIIFGPFKVDKFVRFYFCTSFEITLLYKKDFIAVGFFSDD